MIRLALSIALALVALGCKVKNELSCEIPNNCNDAGDGPDAPVCGPDGTCPNDGICLDPPGVCVECLDATNCEAAEPTCDPVTHECRKCIAHDDCPSDACLPDGTCAAEANVAYVTAGGTGLAPCDKATPCPTIEEALKAARPVMKLSGAIVEADTADFNNKTIRVVAEPNTTIDTSANATVIEVRGASTVEIVDVQISGATGGSSNGVTLTGGTLRLARVIVTNNDNIGIAVNAGTLTLEQSQIIDNDAGGISINNAAFTIRNNFISGNGDPGSGFGGVAINQPGATRVLEFNTITKNVAPGLTPSGVACGIGNVVAGANNIIFANLIGTGQTQVTTTQCTWTFSDIGPNNPPGVVTGDGNIDADPLFASATDFHIMGGSPAKNTANSATLVTDDIDGPNNRPADGRADMGADETPPP